MQKKFVLITPVWGRHHIKLFLEIGLPSLLAPNSLPKLAQLSDVKYFIYARVEDQHWFECAIFKILQDQVDVSIIYFDKIFANAHSTMNWCHIQGFNYALAHKRYAVFIPPDCVWSDNALLAMYNIVKKGYKVIHMSGIRIISEIFSKPYENNQAILCFPARELVAAALKSLHPITHMHFFNEKKGALMPANLFWSVDQSGILARCFHLHPLVVYGKKCEFKSTIDDDLALLFDAKREEEYIVTDSDELIAFEMSTLSHKVTAHYGKGNIEDIVRWMNCGTNKKHRELIKKSIKIHTGPLDSSWDKVQLATDKVVKEIFNQFKDSKKTKKNYFKLDWLSSIILGTRHFKKIFLLYSSFLRKILNISHRLWESSQGVWYPWYWNFCFQKDVSNSLLREIKNTSGNILYIDDQQYPLFNQINALAKDREKLLFDFLDLDMMANTMEEFICIKKNSYDMVLVRKQDIDFIAEIMPTIMQVLKPGGKFIFCLTQNPNSININITKKYLPKEMCFVTEQEYGGLGTKLALNFYFKYYNNKMLHHIIKNSLKVILLPFFIIIYPLLSVLIFLINYFNKKSYVEKRFFFSRQ